MSSVVRSAGRKATTSGYVRNGVYSGGSKIEYLTDDSLPVALASIFAAWLGTTPGLSIGNGSCGAICMMRSMPTLSSCRSSANWFERVVASSVRRYSPTMYHAFQRRTVSSRSRKACSLPTSQPE
jgi:hypothetical protein